MRASLAIVAQAPLVAVQTQNEDFMVAINTNRPLTGDAAIYHFRPLHFSPLRMLQNILHVPDLEMDQPNSTGCSLSSLPAPNITLDTPRHNDLAPSTLVMVVNAFDIPVYIALGDGFITCIRV